jgi:ABC-type lipoprotein release transport system permease subunit
VVRLGGGAPRGSDFADRRENFRSHIIIIIIINIGVVVIIVTTALGFFGALGSELDRKLRNRLP